MAFPKSEGQEPIELAQPRAGARAGEPGGVTPEDCADAIATLRLALKATRRVYGKRKDEFEEQEDWTTRTRAAELLLAYGVGRPVERRIELTLKGESWEEQKTRAMESPEGVRFLLAAGAITHPEAEDALALLASSVATTRE